MKLTWIACSVFAAALSVSTAGLAAKPDGAGHGHDKKQASEKGSAAEIRIGAYFVEEQRQAVTRHYGSKNAGGKCPPGLAKKQNGCNPPGQVKGWARGQPLPSAVMRSPLPGDITVKIGLPPAGYEYVRVAKDILLIAVGTGMVIDAIEDLIK